MAKKSKTTSVSPRTLTDFIEAFARYSSGSDYLKCSRGQQDSSWPTAAGIFRPDLKRLLKNEKRAVRELISVQPHEFASDETMFDKLVRMQHFGLPTRLLDVSRNAMVALFFATDPGPVNSKPSDGLVTAFAIPPELEKDEAATIKATAITVPANHLAMLSHSREVAELIEQAAAKAK